MHSCISFPAFAQIQVQPVSNLSRWILLEKALSNDNFSRCLGNPSAQDQILFPHTAPIGSITVLDQKIGQAGCSWQ